MKLCTVIFGLLVACVASLAAQSSPLMDALRPRRDLEGVQEVLVVDPQTREKRSLLLGAGVLGAGVLGAGILGAGLIGAKAGLIGGALASHAFRGRSYGYGGGYGPYYGGGGYYGGGYGGYGGYRRSYIVEDPYCYY